MIKIYQTTKEFNNEEPYRHVATIDTDCLQDAYRKTQNIDSSWSEEGYRSTSSGDILLHNDIAYFLVPMGNGSKGNKIYEDWGNTEVITNFNIHGFTYEGRTKVYKTITAMPLTQVDASQFSLAKAK